MNFLIDVNIEGKAHDQIFGYHEKKTYEFHINEFSFSLQMRMEKNGAFHENTYP